MFRKLTRPEILTIAILIAVAATTAWPTAEAQFGGGGLGFQGGFATGGIMIEPSQSGNSLYAYSEKSGSWDKLTAEPHPDDGLNAIQSAGLSALRGKQAVHAIGAESGKWATVATDGDPSRLIVSAGAAACV